MADRVRCSGNRGGRDILDKTIKVRFDASKAKGMNVGVQAGRALRWKFASANRDWIFYEATQPDRPSNCRALRLTTSRRHSAGAYFIRRSTVSALIEQVLQPGERVMMPVTFFVDPEIVEDSRSEVDVDTKSLVAIPSLRAIDTARGLRRPDQAEQADPNTNLTA